MRRPAYHHLQGTGAYCGGGTTGCTACCGNESYVSVWPSVTGSDAKTLSQSLQEAVNILEQSLMREEEQSRCAARLNSSVTSATVKLPWCTVVPWFHSVSSRVFHVAAALSSRFWFCPWLKTVNSYHKNVFIDNFWLRSIGVGWH